MIKVWIKTTWTDHDGWEITFKVPGVGTTETRAIADARRRSRTFHDECKWLSYFRSEREEVISIETEEIWQNGTT